MGDPAGIGPEICARWLSDPLSASPCLPLIFGDAGVLDRVAEELGLRQPANVVSHEDFQAAPGDPDGATIID
ncbi:MAG: 4-hydroxythreonine-4-phosphate dehydrogenase PdxA, partial [Planctomycetota bacterium]|nr:4-hydroxythreonine-4-phosphate dehydrogenase PdxA [Planctomycetota bacterium]